MNNDTKFVFKGQQNHAFENYVKYYIIKNNLYCEFKNGEYFKLHTKYETEDSGTLFASMDKNWDIFDTAIKYVRDQEMVELFNKTFIVGRGL